MTAAEICWGRYAFVLQDAQWLKLMRSSILSHWSSSCIAVEMSSNFLTHNTICYRCFCAFWDYTTNEDV